MINTLLERKESNFVYGREQMATAGPVREKMAARLEELGIEKVREP